MCCDVESARKFLGNALIGSVFLFWALNNHIFILIAYVLGYAANDEPLQDMAIGDIPLLDFYDEFTPSLLCFGVQGSIITPIAVVYMVNSMSDYWEEIQSWQISYISWGCSSALLWTAVVLQHRKIFDKIDFKNWILFPFGMATEDADIDLFWWVTPLVATAPASVIGFIANFILDEKFELICDREYNDISTICYDDVCCITRSSQNGNEVIFFMSSLASTILASWGVIKIVVMIAAEGSERVETPDEVFKQKNNEMIDDYVNECNETFQSKINKLIDERMKQYGVKLIVHEQDNADEKSACNEQGTTDEHLPTYPHTADEQSTAGVTIVVAE